jgi:hypothetical protein
MRQILEVFMQCSMTDIFNCCPKLKGMGKKYRRKEGRR